MGKWLVTVVAVLGLVCLGRPTLGDGKSTPVDDKDLPKDGTGDPKITLDEGRKAPGAYRGKRVAWPARPLISSTERFGLMVVGNPKEAGKDLRKARLYVAQFASQKEHDDAA